MNQIYQFKGPCQDCGSYIELVSVKPNDTICIDCQYMSQHAKLMAEIHRNRKVLKPGRMRNT